MKFDEQKYGEVECEAYYDFKCDTVYVKVRRIVRGPNGQLMKKGVMFRLTEEMLDWIAEGCEYVVKTPQPDRWEQIVEEVPENE